MTKKCLGCGSIMQFTDKDEAGYIEEKNYDSATICKRCFRMKYYGEYYDFKRKKDDFIDIVKSVNNTNELVLYVVDLFTLSDNINIINNYLSNDIILVITKRDIMPKSINDEKLKTYIKKLFVHDNLKDIVIISSINNQGFDELKEKIDKYQKSEKVYLVGCTNAGKSTLVNKLVKNYSGKESNITTSLMPATTLNQIKAVLDDKLTLIDTPGLIDETSIINFIDLKTLKAITPKKEINPVTFQLKINKAIELDNLARIEYVKGEKNSFTVYTSNKIKVNQVNINTHKEKYKDNEQYKFDLSGNKDIVINGLGHIKIVKPAIINVYAPKGVSVIERDSLI